MREQDGRRGEHDVPAKPARRKVVHQGFGRGSDFIHGIGSGLILTTIIHGTGIGVPPETILHSPWLNSRTTAGSLRSADKANLLPNGGLVGALI